MDMAVSAKEFNKLKKKVDFLYGKYASDATLTSKEKKAAKAVQEDLRKNLKTNFTRVEDLEV